MQLHNLYKWQDPNASSDADSDQGSTPSQAFIVQCDHTTTRAVDIAQGRVNIVVGFCPLKPAEFVVIQISQLAGQVQ